MAGAGRRRAEWNELLLARVCAPAYAALMVAAAQRLGPGEAYDRCGGEEGRGLVGAFVDQRERQSCCRSSTPSPGMHGEAAADDMQHPPLSCRLWPPAAPPVPWPHLVAAFYSATTRLPVVWTPAGRGSWAAPAAVVWPDATVRADGALALALIALGVRLPQLPLHAIDALQAHMVRRYWRARGRVCGAAAGGGGGGVLPWQTRWALIFAASGASCCCC